MKKITFLVLHLGYGGIERAVSMLANQLVDNYEVNIVSTYKLYDKPFFELDKKVKVEYLINDKPNRELFKKKLKKINLIGAFLEGVKATKILYLKRKKMIDAIKKCDSDIIISTREIHNKWLGLYGNNKTLKIGWEHNHHQNNQRYINKVADSVKNLNYFILVSQELKVFYERKLKNSNCKCVFIPNSIDKISDILSDLKENNLIAVGRLSPEKGFLDLIDVFKIVNDKNPSFKLHIIGDGVEYAEIKKKIEKLNLENKIIMHGYQNRNYINKLLLNSSLSLMTSYTESFGIVLLESFAYGIPCIAFDSANGAKEVIADGVDGYLIKNRDKNTMANKIVEVMDNLELRKKMGEAGYQKVKQYDISVIVKKWEAIFSRKG